MVTKTFKISGQNIVNVGMRPALLDTALDYDVSVHATNIPAEDKVHVIADGDTESIDQFVQYVKNNDIRIKKSDTSYNVSGLIEYGGPEIDWNRYEIRFMASPMTKGFRLANEKLEKIETTLVNLSSKK
jgi:acylphosphatase